MQAAPDVRDALVGLFSALARGDNDAIRGMLCNDDGLVAIGTAPGEYWTGSDHFSKVLGKQIEEAGGGFPIAPTNPVGYRTGGIGWASDQPAMTFPDGTKLPLRFTAVFEQVDDAWKIVQWHASVAVGNEETFGQEFSAE